MVAAISGEAAVRRSKLDGSGGGGGNSSTRLLRFASENVEGCRGGGGGGGGSGNVERRIRSRSVSSRYLSSSPATTSSSSTATSTANSSTSTSTSLTSSSSSSSRRYVSPLVSRVSSSSTSSVAASGLAQLKRSQSAFRRNAGHVMTETAAPEPRLTNAGEVIASKMLFTSSRSLSVSFQGEAFSLPISKAKGQPNVRKGTPEKKRGAVTPLRGKSEGVGGDQVENSQPGEQHRWPARSRPANALSRSMDYSVAENRTNGSSSLGKDLNRSEDWFHSRLSMDLGDPRVCGTNSAHESCLQSDLTASDTDSASSGSTSGLRETNGGMSLSIQLKSGPRGALVSAKFWQETNSRMRRLRDPSSPLSIIPSARMLGPPKCFQSKRFSTDGPIVSPRTTPSPIRGPPRSASPSKFMMSSVSYASRGNSSPSRADVSNGCYSNASSNGPSILSFSADVRRGKMANNLVVNAHLLRLLYNRQLQWRFVNAQAEATFLMQSQTAELPYLEEWFLQDAEHLSSIIGASEALKASILRLPITGKAVADIQNIKDAVRSAVDVMQAIISSLFSLLPKIEEINSLVAELKNATAKEQSLLEHCKGLMSIVAALQVSDCSMKTHILQLNRGHNKQQYPDDRSLELN